VAKEPELSKMKHLRRVGGAVVTTLSVLLVFLALVVPDQITRLPPGNFWMYALVRVPIEALVAIAVLLALPEKWRRALATVLGFVLGLLTVIKIVDMGSWPASSTRSSTGSSSPTATTSCRTRSARPGRSASRWRRSACPPPSSPS
jgi:hypothetical protein